MALTREGWNCRFQKTSRTEGWDKVPGVSAQGSPAGLPFPVPEILEFVAFGNSGKIFQQFSRDFPAIFLQNSRTDPGNSHSLLEFPDSEWPSYMLKSRELFSALLLWRFDQQSPYNPSNGPNHSLQGGCSQAHKGSSRHPTEHTNRRN